MSNQRSLLIGIDETGDFREQKLGTRGKASGVVAVASRSSYDDLRRTLRRVARDHELHYPRDMHAMELFQRARNLGDPLEEEQVEAFLRAVFGAARGQIAFRAAVLGKLPDREFFHEQQAYGELLLCLIHVIAERHGELLRNADEVRVVVATRDHPELTGFTRGIDYHLELCKYLGSKARELGLPRSVRFEPGVATQHPLLMLADFSAAEVRERPEWVVSTADVKLPASYRTTVGELMRSDPVAALLYRLHQGDAIRPSELTRLEPQTAHETLRRLTAAAHANVTDRHGGGAASP